MTLTAALPVTSPASAGEVLAAMQDAAASNDTLAISGAGTWSNAGAPVQATRALSLRHLSGIIAYVPGDLTITAHAGTSLAELSQATAAHGQWLALDPAGDRMGTIGATIATASSGPLAHAFGTPRDLVLGLDAVTGYGEMVKPGGRVVKNVAGFDLVRLYTGSWGTLGPITSLTLRLRALPLHDVTLAIAAPDTARLTELLTAVRQHTVSLMACEWVSGSAATQLGLGIDSGALLVRIGGNDSFVRGQHALLARSGSWVPTDPAVWGALAQLDRDATAVVRVSGSVSALPARIERLQSSMPADVSAMLHASAGRGIVRLVVTGDSAPARALLQASAPGEQRIPERLPEAWWATETDPFAGGLAGRIRAAFDPDTRCNRRAVADA